LEVKTVILIISKNFRKSKFQKTAKTLSRSKRILKATLSSFSSKS